MRIFRILISNVKLKDSLTSVRILHFLIEGLQSAADFYLEEANGRLLLPDMKAGLIYSVDIEK